MNLFRTFETSDPRFEWEGCRFLTVKSEALKARADLTIWAPTGARPEGLLLLLHGAYGSHWAWAFKGGAHRTAARLIEEGEIPPLALAMPSDGLWGDGSGYVRHERQDFERWIVDEVPAAARMAIPDWGGAGWMGIAGLSMGGYAALRLGAKYGDRFIAAVGHSSITELPQLTPYVAEPLLASVVAGEYETVLAAVLRNRDRLPALRFDCGIGDALLGANRALHRSMEEAGIAHEYAEHPGGHDWPYWERHFVDTLRFLARVVASSR